MWTTLKRLTPGIALILAAAAVLLAVDGISLAAPVKGIPEISILQIASRPVMDDSVRGAVEGLRESGFEEGKNLSIRYLNPENDIPTANSMARLVVSSRDRLVITFSSPLLQIMANVNKAGRITHIFGTVTDPFAAGVGITRTSHPSYIAGIGTFQPVRETLQLAKKLQPGLRTIGTVWNPGDAAAQACVSLAREECSRLGIALVETQVDSTTGVAEAASALTSRGVEAIWIGGDNTVELAFDSVVTAARKARIPLFCNAPIHLASGAFVALGADYREVGRLVGKMAAKILLGEDVAEFPIDNVVPRQLGINLGVLDGLSADWQPDPAILAEAAILIDRGGKTVRSPALSTTSADNPPASRAKAASLAYRRPKPWKLQILNYVDSLTTEETHEGIFRELGARGLAEGRDYEMKLRSAHGDMAILNGIVDAAIGDRPDLVITTSTPTLQVAVNKIKTFPVVFSTVADGVLSGAGTSDESHLPNFTGVNTMSDFEGMMSAIVECMPSARSIGTLFAPGEINSVRYRDELVRAAAKRGITVLVAAVSTTTEVSDAANALAAKRPDIIAQVTDNISSSAFPAIVAAAKKAGIPLFGFVSSAVEAGAAAVVARDFSEAGAQAVRMALRILDGEDPGRMPFESLKTSVLLLSPANAKSYGLVFPESLVKRADKVVR